MAFTFTVEDGTGVPGANSYVAVEEADDIIAMNIHAASKWNALDVTFKEKLLAWASRYLDTHARWEGRKTTETSPLRWPRTNVRDRDRVLIQDYEIPRQLRIATAEMARYLIDTDRTVEREQDGLVSLKADVVELEFKDGYRLPQIPDHLHSLIHGLGTLSAGRSRFKRIIR